MRQIYSFVCSILLLLIHSFVCDYDDYDSGAPLPEGWRVEEDPASLQPLYRNTVSGAAQRAWPTQRAADVVPKATRTLSATQRAVVEKKLVARQVRTFADPGAERAAAVLGDATAAAAAAAAAAKAQAKAQAKEAAALKESIVARQREAEAAALRAKAKRAVAVVSVAALLGAIGLPGAMQSALEAQFDSAGVDDAALAHVINLLNDDPEGEGEFALDEMIEAVGLRGGAAAKVRAKLLKKKGGGGGAQGKGECNGGRGGKQTKQPAASKVKKNVTATMDANPFGAVAKKKKKKKKT